MPKKVQSPCIGVCKYKRRGHCIGCSMTRDQKKLFKKIKKDKHREAFVLMLVGQQSMLGKYAHWLPAYLRKCMSKGTRPAKVARDTAA